LRQQCPFSRVDDVGEHGFCIPCRNDDIATALKDAAGWSTRLDTGPGYRPVVGEGAVARPPPQTAQHNLAGKAPTPRVVAEMEPRIRGIVDDLLDAVRTRGRGGLIRDFAHPLPVLAITTMLGPARDRLADYKRWSDAFIAATETGSQAGVDTAATLRE
jgi:cytochrome P450 family 109